MEAVQKLAVHLWHEYEWTLTIAGHNAYTHYSVLTTLLTTQYSVLSAQYCHRWTQLLLLCVSMCQFLTVVYSWTVQFHICIYEVVIASMHIISPSWYFDLLWFSKFFYYYLIFTFWFKVLTAAFTVICHDLSVSSVCRHYHIIIFTGCISLSVFAELLWWMFFRRSSGRLASDVCVLAYICLDGCLLNYRVHWTKVDDIAASIRVSMDAICVQCCLSCVELPHLFWGLLTSIYCTKL